MKRFTPADFDLKLTDQFEEDVRFYVVAEGAHDKSCWETFVRRNQEDLSKFRIQQDIMKFAAFKVAGIEANDFAYMFSDEAEVLKDSPLLPDLLELNEKVTKAEYTKRVLQEVGYNQGHIADTRAADAKRFETAEWTDDQIVSI